MQWFLDGIWRGMFISVDKTVCSKWVFLAIFTCIRAESKLTGFMFLVHGWLLIKSQESDELQRELVLWSRTKASTLVHKIQVFFNIWLTLIWYFSLPFLFCLKCMDASVRVMFEELFDVCPSKIHAVITWKVADIPQVRNTNEVASRCCQDSCSLTGKSFHDPESKHPTIRIKN